MLKSIRDRIALLSLIALLAACTTLPATPPASPGPTTEMPAQAPAVGVTKEVLVTKVTPGPSPTPLACTPLPEDMTLQVEALSPTGLQVEVSGLRPDERPTLILSSEVPRVGSKKLTTQDVEPVGADGRYTYQTRWLEAVGTSIQLCHNKR